MRSMIVRIARRAVVHVFAGEVVGVFAHVERADEDRAGRFQPLDQRRVARGRRHVAVDLRAGQRRQAGDVEQILDRERHAGQRAERARRARAWRRSLRARSIARCSVTAVKEFSTGSRSRMRASVASTTLSRRGAAGADRGRDFGSRAEIEIGCGHIKHETSRTGVAKLERPGRLGVVGQGEFVDQRRMAQDQLQIEFARRLATTDRASGRAPVRLRNDQGRRLASRFGAGFGLRTVLRFMMRLSLAAKTLRQNGRRPGGRRRHAAPASSSCRHRCRSGQRP